MTPKKTKNVTTEIFRWQADVLFWSEYGSPAPVNTRVVVQQWCRYGFLGEIGMHLVALSVVPKRQTIS